MAKWLAKEFDWTLGQYTGGYYDVAEAGIVAVFVCSYTGNDTNAGTAAAPFKTLSKAITTLNATGANGSRIFMNGVFSETLPTQTYWYHFIGCGGGRFGRVIWLNNISTNICPLLRKSLTILENVETLDYTTSINSFFGIGNVQYYFYFVNCWFKDFNQYMNRQPASDWSRLFLFNCVLQNIRWQGTNTARGCHLSGNLNIFYNMIGIFNTNLVGNFSLSLSCNNSYFLEGDSENPLTIYDPGAENRINIDARFINPEVGNFYVEAISPLLFAGSKDGITGIGEHIGGVNQGFSFSPYNYALSSGGGATLTNLEISNGRLIRTDPNIAGSLETGSIDLGAPYPITQLTVENIFEYDTTAVSKGVFEDLTGSPRPALTILMKYGSTEAERDACPWLEVEYGKRPTYSGSGASRLGNGDDTFDSDNELTITARYFKYKFTLQDR